MKEAVNQLIKTFVKKTPLYIPLRNRMAKWRQNKELADWRSNRGEMPVPHLLKQHVLEDIARKYQLSILVETGTYYGDMVEAMKNKFEMIYSIELSFELYLLAKRRFSSDKNVLVLHGDSGREIKSILPGLKMPALFWLDAHYSAGITARAEKDTPVLDELSHILADSKQHVVVIDDARCFGVDAAYPTIEQLKVHVGNIRPGAEIEVKDDSIRIYPAAS